MPRQPASSTLAWWLAGAALLFVAAIAAADERARLLWIQSLLLGACVAAIAVPIGTVLALLLGRCEILGRSLALPLLAFCLFQPLYLQAAGWQAGFGTQGWFTVFCWPPGIPPPLSEWRGAVAVHAIAAIPWVVLLIWPGMTQANPDVEDAAALEGGAFGSLLYVTLPLLAPQIALAALWVIVSTIGEMTVTDLFAVRTIAEEVYLGYARDSLEDIQLAALPALAGIGALVLVAGVAATSLAPAEAPLPEPRRWKLGAYAIPAAVVLLGIAGLLVALPLANLLAKGGWLVVGEGEERHRIWSAAALARVVAETPARYAEEIGWSLGLGAAAASLAWLISLGAWPGRRGPLFGGFALAVVAIGLAVPGPFVGWSLAQVFNQPDFLCLHDIYDRTGLVMVLAQMIRALPLVLLICWQAFAAFPRSIEELAALDGASTGTFWSSILWPLRWPALAGAWVAGLALAMGELAGSVMIRPPGITPVSWVVFDLLHSGVDDRLAGLCLVWSFLFAGVTAAAISSYRRQHDEIRQESFVSDRSARQPGAGL